MDKPHKHFFGSYLGNKTKDIKYFREYLPTSSNIIVEPFCGTFAICRNVYYDTNKYLIHINDTSPTIKYIIELLKDYNKFSILYDKLKEINNNNINEKKHVNTKKFLNDLHDSDILEPTIIKYVENSFIIRGMGKKIPNINYEPLSDYINKILFTNNDYSDILDQYKDNEDAFLFCDPPYFSSDNTGYQDFTKSTDNNKNIIDNTKMYIDLSKYIKECKCKIMIIINDNNLMRYIFENYIKGSYDITYQISKNKTKHIIITNYDLTDI